METSQKRFYFEEQELSGKELVVLSRNKVTDLEFSKLMKVYRFGKDFISGWSPLEHCNVSENGDLITAEGIAISIFNKTDNKKVFFKSIETPLFVWNDKDFSEEDIDEISRKLSVEIEVQQEPEMEPVDNRSKLEKDVDSFLERGYMSIDGGDNILLIKGGERSYLIDKTKSTDEDTDINPLIIVSQDDNEVKYRTKNGIELVYNKVDEEFKII